MAKVYAGRRTVSTVKKSRDKLHLGAFPDWKPGRAGRSLRGASTYPSREPSSTIMAIKASIRSLSCWLSDGE